MYHVRVVERAFYSGYVKARNPAHAVELVNELWSNEDQCIIFKLRDDELDEFVVVDVVAHERGAS